MEEDPSILSILTICQSCFCDESGHQRYLFHQDASCACLLTMFKHHSWNIMLQFNYGTKALTTLVYTGKMSYFEKPHNSPIRPWPWLTWPRSFLVFFLLVVYKIQHNDIDNQPQVSCTNTTYYFHRLDLPCCLPWLGLQDHLPWATHLKAIKFPCHTTVVLYLLYKPEKNTRYANSTLCIIIFQYIFWNRLRVSHSQPSECQTKHGETSIVLTSWHQRCDMGYFQDRNKQHQCCKGINKPVHLSTIQSQIGSQPQVTVPPAFCLLAQMKILVLEQTSAKLQKLQGTRCPIHQPTIKSSLKVKSKDRCNS